MGTAAMKDEEIQDLVCRLQEVMSERICRLEAVQAEVQTIQSQIQERNKHRQVFVSSTTHIDEAADLVAEHKLLRDILQAKQAELRNLQEGSASEQRDLVRVQEQLEELHKCQLHVVSQREQDMASLEELKKKYQDMQESCDTTGTQTEKAKQKLTKHKTDTQSHKTKLSRKPLSVRLDQFIAKSCRNAGLQL